MNKEFMKLPDGSIEVTDETGHILERNCDTTQEILLAENKIEIIDKKLNNLMIDLYARDHKKHEFAIFLKSLLMAIILIAPIGMGYGVGYVQSLDFISLISGALAFEIVLGPLFGIPAFIVGVLKKVNDKKINKIYSEIEVSKKLREVYEKELGDLLEQQKIVDDPTITINEPVSLIEQTNMIEMQINEELNTAYTESLNGQKLVLKRKK